MKNFILDVLRLLLLIGERHPKSLLYVVFFELISVLAKASSVLLIAGVVYFIRNEGAVNVFGETYQLTMNMTILIIFGFLVFIAGLAESHFSYLSFKLTRKLGRKASIESQDNILNFLGVLSPNVLAQLPSNNLQQINIKHLTQIPAQVGMSNQTVSLMINPVFTIVVSMVLIAMVDIWFAFASILFGVAALPLIYFHSKNVQKNSEEFFNRQASKMGGGSNQLLKQCFSQIGAYNKDVLLSNWQSLNGVRDRFFESLDINMLASRKMGNYIGNLAALTKGLLLTFLLYLYFYTDYSLESLIIVLFLLTQLFGSSRTLMSLMSKLFIYRPQLKEFFRMSRELNNLKLNILNANEETNFHSSDKAASKVKTIFVEYSDKPYQLIDLIGKLNEVNEVKYSISYAVDATATYISGVTLIDMLSGGNITQEKLNRIEEVLKKLDAYKVFVNFNEKGSLILNEYYWKKMSAVEKFVVKLGGILHAKESEVVYINSKILQQLGNHRDDVLRLLFEKQVLIIIQQVEKDDCLIELDSVDQYSIFFDKKLIDFENKITAINSKEYIALLEASKSSRHSNNGNSDLDISNLI